MPWWNHAHLEATPSVLAKDWELGDYKLSGPYTYENLTIFLVHGEGNPHGKSFLTLEEALERKVVVVHETGDVNELVVENVSRNEEVFVQAGDIVKGGQQDRVLSVDLIVPARSGGIPINAFCVEHGRWSQRGAEVVTSFEVSPNMVATKELKMAAKSTRSQGEVWDKVEQEQAKLSRSACGSQSSPIGVQPPTNPGKREGARESRSLC